MTATAIANLLRVQEHQLDDTIWTAAAVLAGLRRASNERIRRRDRDRGQRKNILNDVLGAIAELVALQACATISGAAVEHALFNPYGPESGTTDIVLRRRRELRLEAKGHFITQSKWYFAINKRAHDRSNMRRAEGYVPVVSATGARIAVTGRIIPIRAVDEWKVTTLGKHPDPALVMPLSSVYETWFDDSAGQLPEKVVASVDSTVESLVLQGEAAGYDHFPLARRQRLELPPSVEGSIAELTRLANG